MYGLQINVRLFGHPVKINEWGCIDGHLCRIDLCHTEPVKKRRRPLALLLISILGLACSSGETGGPTSSTAGEDAAIRQEIVATGTIGSTDRTWELGAELTNNDLCLELRGRVCVGIPTDDIALQGMASSAGTEDDGPYSCTYGAVSPRVAEVLVSYADGSQATAEIFDGSSWGVDFFALCLDQNLSTSSLELADESGGSLTFND
jgi:hypothetical protein